MLKNSQIIKKSLFRKVIKKLFLSPINDFSSLKLYNCDYLTTVNLA